MKNVFFLFLTLFFYSLTIESQNISDNAIGLRLGDSNGFGAEVSYQRAILNNNRLELDLGWRDGNNFSAFRFAGIYQWVYLLDGNFNWYVGGGGGIATFNVDDGDNNTGFFVAGNIGIEYDFDIPLLISLDFRPELGFAGFNSDLDLDIALGLRYQF